MKGKRITFDVVTAYSTYARYRIGERSTVAEAFEQASQKTGINVRTLKVRAMREGWEKKLADLMPAMQAILPTSTTDHKVISQQREKFLTAANDMLDKWTQGTAYLWMEFNKAKDLKNLDRCDEILRSLNNYARLARHAQEISSHATCDSGSSLAAPDTGSPQISGNRTMILLAREIMHPRIEQPRPEPKTIELRIENAA